LANYDQFEEMEKVIKDTLKKLPNNEGLEKAGGMGTNPENATKK